MDRKRLDKSEEAIRMRTSKARAGQDRAQAEPAVEAARNPVGNGQGDAQADDPTTK